MQRHKVVQSFLDMFELPKYLEIGVRKGLTFHHVEAAEKVGVDPNFIFQDSDRQSNAEYHPITSDEYFGGPNYKLFDVVYLDGMHTFDQTLRDLLNAITRTHSRSVIIIDDVCPPTPLSAIADRKVFNEVRSYIGNNEYKVWMGDVYKLIHFIESYMQQYSYATVADNHGQTVVWSARRSSVKVKSNEKIASMNFNDFVLMREDMNFKSLQRIIEIYKSDTL